jgi:hypothetical protein
MNEAEIDQISRKYESFRLRDKSRERYLLQSILEYGIREPLQCVAEGRQRYVLLDGFKRLRCSHKLKLSLVPVAALGTDEVSGILQLVRSSVEKSLNTLEQARFIDELHARYGLTVTDIASSLERSKAWVSVRLGIIDEMSEVVRDAVFSGGFPLRSYMYTVSFRQACVDKSGGGGTISHSIAKRQANGKDREDRRPRGVGGGGETVWRMA